VTSELGIQPLLQSTTRAIIIESSILRAASSRARAFGPAQLPFSGANMDRPATLAAEWERAKAGAQDYLDAVGADHLSFRPAEGSRSAAEQFLHIASRQYAFASSATGRANPLDALSTDPEKDEKLMEDPNALRKFVLGSYDFMIDGVRGLDPTTLDDEVAFFRRQMSRSLILAKAMEHHAHHRGQVAVYLRLSGLTPPSQRLF
jgi:uncharacterized damage-inducible protein DinB